MCEKVDAIKKKIRNNLPEHVSESLAVLFYFADAFPVADIAEYSLPSGASRPDLVRLVGPANDWTSVAASSRAYTPTKAA
jgi:hypothetical protein